MSDNKQKFQEIAKHVEETPFEVTREQEKLLMKAKIDLSREFPFMGFLVMSTKYIWTDQVPTLAATTNPVATVYVNPKCFETVLVNKRQRAFAVAHELLHIFLEHIGRQRDHNYNHQLWNVATDFCINLMLRLLEDDTNLENRVMELPDWVLQDDQYIGDGADKIYHKLLEENDNDVEKALAQFGMAGDGEGDEEGQQRVFDEVSSENVSDATKVENRQKVASSVSNSSEGDRRPGSARGDMIRMFEEMFQPVIPWTALLAEFITQSSKTRHTYSRVSRRSSEIVFPTMTGDHVKVAFGVDTSGSMNSNDLADAMGEMKSIMEGFDSWELDLISCDTKAHTIGSYNSEDGDDFQTVDKQLIGGGGTSMEPIVRLVNELDEAPAVCVIVTDGYIPDDIYPAEEEVPVILLVTRDGNKELTLTGDSAIIHMNDF